MGLFTKAPLATKNYVDIFTTAPIGKKINKNFGMIQAEIHGISGKYGEADTEAVEALREEARKLGANAVVNFRYSFGTYEQAVNSVHAMLMIVYGDAVLLEE